MVVRLGREHAENSGPACVDLASSTQEKRISAPEPPPPDYSGSAFETCISEPAPATGIGNGLDAINTLVSELSDVESLTVISPRSGSGDVRVTEALIISRSSQHVYQRRYTAPSDFSRQIKPMCTVSSQPVSDMSSVSADLAARSAGITFGSQKYKNKRLCSADQFALPKLACAPLVSEMNGSVMLSDEDDADTASMTGGLEPMPSQAPSISQRDSICGTFRPISPHSAASHRPPSCNFMAPMPPPGSVAAEDSVSSPEEVTQLLPQPPSPHGPAPAPKQQPQPDEAPDEAPSTSAEPAATDDSMEALILRMGAAVGAMSVLARPDSSSSMLSTNPEVKQRQQALLLQCVETMESFLPVACGPIDSEMGSLQPDTSTMPSRMPSMPLMSSMKGSNFSMLGGSMMNSGLLPAAMTKSRPAQRGVDSTLRGSSFMQYSGLLAQRAAQRRMQAAAARSISPVRSSPERRGGPSLGQLPEQGTPSEMGVGEDYMVMPAHLRPVRVHATPSPPTSRTSHRSRSRGVSSHGASPSHAPQSESRSKWSGKDRSGGGSRNKIGRRPRSKGRKSEASRALGTSEGLSSSAQRESLDRAARQQRRVTRRSGGKSSEPRGLSRRLGGSRKGPAVMEPGSAKGESVERVSHELSGRVLRDDDISGPMPRLAEASTSSKSGSRPRESSPTRLPDKKRSGSGRSKKSGEEEQKGCFANFWGTNRKKEKKAQAPKAPKILAPEIPKEKGQGCGIQCGCL
eukprot:jgi/Ulvmu1/576/UM001_0584.1